MLDDASFVISIISFIGTVIMYLFSFSYRLAIRNNYSFSLEYRAALTIGEPLKIDSVNSQNIR